MGKSQRVKGANGELEFAKILQAHGYNAKRHGRHFHGLEGHTHADIIHDVPDVHFEVKRCERVDVWSWIDQAREGAGRWEIPVVAFRKNHRPWFVILLADDFLPIVKNQRTGRLEYGDALPLPEGNE